MARLFTDVAWVNILRFNANRSTADWLLQFPADFDPELARQLRLGGAVIPSREGLVIPQHFKGHSEYLRVLTGRDAIITWLGKKGVNADVSSSGRVTEQVIASVTGLGGMGLLANKSTLQLLDNVAKSVRKFDNGTVEEYPDRSAAAEEWTSLIARRKQDPWSRYLSLDHFIDAGILKFGLLINCSNRTHNNWYGISDLTESLLCDRCRKRYAFPQDSLNFVNSPWRFRVVGPFAVPDYANGAYATALSLQVFNQLLSVGDVTLTYAPGLNFSVAGRSPFEIDFGFWYSRNGWRDERDVISGFGEAKSFAEKAFTAKDVGRMRLVSELFPGSFLVFAALKEELSTDERAMIAELANWGREPLEDGRPRAPVIVLTGVELFSPWYITNSWKQLHGLRKLYADRPVMRLDHLWTLADVTQQVYLGLPSRFEEMQQRSAARRAAGQTAAKTIEPPTDGAPL